LIPFYLITGFLGSGKTSYLKNLLTNQPERGKIAVVQNEFAPNSIDGQEIKRIAPGIELVEINNGSVFCACLLGNFIETLKQLINGYKPDCIYLEASGLSDPGTLMQIISDEQLQQKVYLAGSVCLVDVLNF
jgi:G3E family GTPase